MHRCPVVIYKTACLLAMTVRAIPIPCTPRKRPPLRIHCLAGHACTSGGGMHWQACTAKETCMLLLRARAVLLSSPHEGVPRRRMALRAWLSEVVAEATAPL